MVQKGGSKNAAPPFYTGQYRVVYAAVKRILYQSIEKVFGRRRSGARPHRQAGVDQPIELFPSRAMGGLEGYSLKDGLEEVGQTRTSIWPGKSPSAFARSNRWTIV